MPRPIEEKPKSFSEFVELVEKYQKECSTSLWYRGSGKSSYNLLAGLYRHRTCRSPAGFADLEKALLTHFRQRSIPFHSRNLLDDWDTLFFMQHYRVPTRLLDWTENPFVGFHFAVMNAPFEIRGKSTLKFASDATVWILDPIAWSRYTLRHQSYEGGILAPGDEALKGYVPCTPFSAMNNAPVALYGAHNSPRIVAQRGVFMIFGQDTSPMERTFESDSYPSQCLIKVVLQRRYLPELRKAILRYGITESVIFPDLDGLAREIRRTFAFEE